MTTPLNHDKRIDERVTLEIPSSVSIVQQELEGVPIDISKSGIRLRTKALVPPNTEVSLMLFNGTIRCKAKVCWVSPGEQFNEVGLKLDYLDDVLLPSFMGNLPSSLEQIHITLFTSNAYSAQSIDTYLRLAGVQTSSVYDAIGALSSLSNQPTNLLIIDEASLSDSSQWVEVLQNPEWRGLPIILVVDRLSRDVLQFCASHSFVEILTKPIYAQDLLLRSIVLMEQAGHYSRLEGKLHQTQQQLESEQASVMSQQKEMLSMISQVTKASKDTKQLIQLQESLSELQTLEDISTFFQKWVLLNFSTAINIWHYHQRKIHNLGDFLIPYGNLTFEQRQQGIYDLLHKDESLVKGEITLIRRGPFILEVLTSEASDAMIEGLSFFMKVLSPVLQLKLHELEIKKAYLEIEDALEKETESRKLLDRELQVAAEFQNILIPKKLPDVASLDMACHYQSAADLGGDWFQVYPFQPLNQVLIGIGDVTGHGAKAALVTAIVSGFFADLYNRYSVIEDPMRDLHGFPGPGAILGRLNRIVCDTTRHTSLMTLFLSFYNEATKQLSFASASHTPLLWFRPKGFKDRKGRWKNTKQLLERGLRLGDHNDSRYSETTIKLKKGDFLVWFTDGLIEYTNESGDAYSLKRLMQLLSQIHHLPATEAIQAIMKDVRKFGGTKPLEDDLAIVVANVK